MLKEIEKERQVLVIFPHPDDEAFGVSGTIATYTKMSVPVTYACLTLGEMGRNLGNPHLPHVSPYLKSGRLNCKSS